MMKYKNIPFKARKIAFMISFMIFFNIIVEFLSSALKKYKGGKRSNNYFLIMTLHRKFNETDINYQH